MLNAVIRFALRQRLLVLAASLVLLVYGAYLGAQLPIDVFPDLDRPRVWSSRNVRGWPRKRSKRWCRSRSRSRFSGRRGCKRSAANRRPASTWCSSSSIGTPPSAPRGRPYKNAWRRSRGFFRTASVRLMTPPSSIMGQIVIAGLYRQPGPEGGVLARVSDTPWMAELVATEQAKPTVRVWEPTDRRDTRSWKTVPAETVRLDSAGTAEVPIRAVVRVAGQSHEVEFPTPVQQRMALRTFADWVAGRDC